MSQTSIVKLISMHNRFRKFRLECILADWLAARDLAIANMGNEATFSRRGRESILDLFLTVVSLGLVNRIANWQVLPDKSLSDHHLLYFEIGLDLVPERELGCSKSAEQRWRFKADKAKALKEKISEELARVRGYCHGFSANCMQIGATSKYEQ